MAVTTTQVRALNEDWADVTDVVMNEFISDANVIATERLVGSSYSTAHQDAITKWLAAHLFAMRSGENRLTRDKLSDLEQEYGDSLGRGLDGTVWGQQVRVLDTKGLLSNLGAKKAELRAIVIE